MVDPNAYFVVHEHLFNADTSRARGCAVVPTRTLPGSRHRSAFVTGRRC
jgi:hypothetical protein